MNFLRGSTKGRITEAAVLKHFKKRAQKGRGLFYKISDRYMTGFPDLIYIVDANVFFIELKRPGENPTPAQAKHGLKIKAAGGNWICIDSIESVDRFFNQGF